ncbi:hypothetical protein [Cupriavidus sp. AU9028]|uniref:hypothetical protein n=1 Tax=Cupriavidus sp. AU9028 TaxID=2871157 RepID=UPI001C980076|nr:hypothetical protein [Cupriavidus sp. AU9028]MBY4897526.1 hypothetical protein [Cupriavidus sp. AU9028]
MCASLLAQEIYLLERYSSIDYFGDLRDAWSAMIDHVEDCLSRFMSRLPPDYRSRPVPKQPDIVWGQRVLPNFRQSLQTLDDAFIRLTHGDASALRAASAITGDVRGQNDFSSDWFDEVEPGSGARYGELLSRANQMAVNVETTISIGWLTGALSQRYSSRRRGELHRPQSWPRYTLDSTVQVRTGQPAPESGIYLPDVPDAAAQFLLAGRKVAPAMTGFDGQQYVREEPAVWTRVRRVQSETVNDGLADLLTAGPGADSMKVAGGQPCPRAGWWLTPSQAQSRRYFRQGEVFPIIEGSAYGSTFWQWDRDQDEPSLRQDNP